MSIGEWVVDPQKKIDVYRARVSQPSKFQPLHSYNGVVGIVVDQGGATVRLFLTDGPVVSMEIPRNTVVRHKLSAADNS